MIPPRPPYFPWISPYITVKDVDKAVDFYAKAFGFIPKEKVPGEDGTSWHAEMFYQDQILMFGKEGAYGSSVKAPLSTQTESPINMYIYCENVDHFFEKAVSEGALAVSLPETVFWGDRMCRLKCPENYLWIFATYQGGPCLPK